MKRYFLVPVTPENEAKANEPTSNVISLDDEYITEQAEDSFWNTEIDKYHKEIYIAGYLQCAQDIRELIS